MTILITDFLEKSLDFCYSLEDAAKLALNRQQATMNIEETDPLSQASSAKEAEGRLNEVLELKEKWDFPKLDRMIESIIKEKYSDNLDDFYIKKEATKKFIQKEIEIRNNWTDKELVEKSEKTFTAFKTRLDFAISFIVQEAKETKTEELEEWAEKFETLQKNYETKEKALQDQIQDLENKLKDLTDQKNQTEQELKEFKEKTPDQIGEDRKKELEETIKELKTKLAAYENEEDKEELKAEVKNLEEQLRVAEELTDQPENQTVSEKIKYFSGIFKRISKQSEKIGKELAKVKEEKDKLSDLQGVNDLIQQELNQSDKKITELQDKIKAFNTELTQSKTEIKTWQDKYITENKNLLEWKWKAEWNKYLWWGLAITLIAGLIWTFWNKIIGMFRN